MILLPLNSLANSQNSLLPESKSNLRATEKKPINKGVHHAWVKKLTLRRVFIAW